MPAPRSIARFNKRFTNRLTLKVAGYMPGFAIVTHIGRKSGRKEAAAKPLGIGLSGVVVKIVTRAYHLYALSSTPQRVRVGLDWILDAVLPRPLVRLRIGKEEDAPLAAVERTGIYEDPGQRLTRG